MFIGIFSALAQSCHHLRRVWSLAAGGATANPEALLFGYLRRAAAPAPTQVCASRFSFRVSPAAPAGGRAAGGGAREAGSSGAPEQAGGVRESPEEDGLRTQPAELLQSPQKGKGLRRRSLPSEGRRVRNRSAAGTVGAAGPPPVPPGVPGGGRPEAGAEGGGESSARRRSFPHQPPGPGLSRAGQPSLATRPPGPGSAANSGCLSREMSSAVAGALFLRSGRSFAVWPRTSDLTSLGLPLFPPFGGRLSLRPLLAEWSTGLQQRHHPGPV